MTDWLGIGHLLELSAPEAAAGFFTPLAIFAAFFLAQLVLPGVRVPGYVVDSRTGQTRRYRLNGILVFAIALAVWALELTGMPRDWFYRSSIFAVAGGTVFTAIFTAIAVLTRPADSSKGLLEALWVGRVRELSFFNHRLDLNDVFLCRRRDDAVAQRPLRGPPTTTGDSATRSIPEFSCTRGS